MKEFKIGDRCIVTPKFNINAQPTPIKGQIYAQKKEGQNLLYQITYAGLLSFYWYPASMIELIQN